MPRGADPHEWQASAKDIAALERADLIVRNGLGLESGLQKPLDRAQKDGVPTFVASDHIHVRHVAAGQGIPGGDPDQAVGAPDPHLWTDPLTMRDVVLALGKRLDSMGLDGSAGARAEARDLTALDTRVRHILAGVAPGDRKLVTGHESLGYFADRYGFELVGAVIPSLSTQAQTSAADLARLKKQIEREHPKAIFTEVGTPQQVVRAIGGQMHVRVVPVATEVFPADGSYDTYMTQLASTIANGLR
jgi:zinc/manganese transport system substrate-binding protein